MAAVRAFARPARSLALVLMAGASVAACVSPKYASRLPSTPGAPGAGISGPHYKVGKPYQVGGIWYTPREQPDYDETGVASWYGPGFHMKATANGETFDQALVSAAHTTLPLPSWVEVENLENGRKLEVRVNDRGPFVGGRIIDLSQEAARRLGFEQKGTARVRVRYLGPAQLPTSGLQYASNTRNPAPAAMTPVANPAPSAPPEDLWAPPKTVSSPSTVSATELTPLDLPPAAPPASAPALTPASTTTPLTSTIGQTAAFRIQAGAFTNWDNARKTADAIDASGVGRAKIETVYEGGVNIYRVLIDGAADEIEAASLRERVVATGFADARVVRR
ncbi:septal ring lytic transglycosylase RlpA family protein [Phenylobacterium sp.]|jgi:rare lipoprotein A|uniref:septal ring lytic transglycosylase RlpA family protein n=1 Tax=Phenylobacterium sp. TaxID=1871053 RepID=UPI002E2FCA57|nr:septal ring lytic transglycosylase RlpA family protein [Phenylobacterium sp.]HEX2561983.1 septal ring lytic transglycosylase RlpA family protein [Phenylobacterium sp.]